MAHGAAQAFGAGAPGDLWSVAMSSAPGAWIVRPEVAAPLLIAACACAVGWRRLRRRGGSASGWRVAASAGGLLSVLIALSAPLDRLAHVSFAAHMLQHLLLIVGAAPLLLLADPFAALCWALPAPVRSRAGRLLRPGTPLRSIWRGLTTVSVAWLAHVAAVWLWHLPSAYDAAVADRVVHDVEHLIFFGTAVLFWWPIVQPAPRLRVPTGYGIRVGYLVLAALQGALLGLLLTMSRETWYRAYPSAEDQSLGGLVMWGIGGAVDMLAVLILVGCYLGTQDRAERRDPPDPAPKPLENSTERQDLKPQLLE
jgi:cytochrome c oxidase assembly factor CtaG